MKCAATLGNKCATSLDHSSWRLFWASCTLIVCTSFGDDDTNDFAKVLPPIEPLYVTIDKNLRSWCTNYKTLLRCHKDMCCQQ